MLGVFNTIARMWQLQIATLANRIIFYTRRLPWLRGLISEQAYAAVRAKRTAGAVAVVLRSIAGLLESLLYFGVMIALPVVLWADERKAGERLELFMHMYFCISVLMAGITSAKIMETNEVKYTAVRLMRIAPTRFMRAVLVYRYTTFFLYQWIALTVIARIFGISALQALMLVVTVTMWRVGSEWLHLIMFRRSNIVLVKKTGIIVLVMLLTLAAAYLPLTTVDGVPLFGAMAFGQPLLIALLLFFGVFSGYVLLKKTDFTAEVRAVTNHDDPLLNMEQMMADVQRKAVQANERDYRENPSPPYSFKEAAGRKKGYAYMHELFIARHNSLIRAPLRRRLAAIMVVGVMLVSSALLFAADHLDVNSLERFLPLLILAMFHLTMGMHLCKVLFYHCDITLMRYYFYRKNAVQHFRLRLGWMMGMNVRIGAGFATVLSVFVLILSKGEVHSILLPIWLLTLTLAVFFSVHHLLLYYLLQPYSTELNTKNPLFTLLNSLISVCFIVAMVLRLTPWTLASVVTTLSLAYLFSALPLVSKFAESRFSAK
ncbi:hypothetical protein [Paenibacillus sp. CR_12]|uniref:hypothetical protein n=1 Tax=Paenibacillus sp. CR_12 TaxID=3055793 RepID=UPI0035C1BE18